jgi:DNA polymerase-3 subunit beta
MSTSIVEGTSLLSVKLSQQSFNQALSLVSKAVAKHGIQPVLSNVLLKANAQSKTLTFAATDLDLSLAINVPAEVLEEGEVTVPAQKLQELVGKLPHLDLTLHSSDKALISISCGRSKFEIKGLSAEQFPQDFLKVNNPAEATNEESNEFINLPIQHLQKSAQLVSFASDKREVNSILNGICVELSERGLEVAATDGSRLAYYNAPDCKSDEAKKVVIPFRTVNELSKLIAGLDEEHIKFYVANSAQISLKTDSRMLSSSLIDGSYPKYQQLIPANHAHKAIVDRANFLSALERVSVLANERTKVVKLLFEEIGVLTISASTPDLGEAQDQIDIAEYNGQDFSIAFNVNYMLECLRNLDSEQVEMKMSEPLQPIIVSPVNQSKDEDKVAPFNYFYLLMPLRTRPGA